MNDTQLKGIVKALDTGIKVAKRIVRATATDEEIFAHVCEAARNLQNVLEVARRELGQARENGGHNRLKEIRVELIECINDCEVFDDEDPETFKESIVCFERLELKAGECVVVCGGEDTAEIQQLGERKQLEIGPQKGAIRVNVTNMEAEPEKPLPQTPGIQATKKDDRILLSSMRQPASVKDEKIAPTPSQQWSQLSAPIAEPMKPSLTIAPPVRPPIPPKSPWVIENPAQFSTGASPLSPRSISPSSRDTVLLIGRDIISRRLSANDDFLERRRQSRIEFQNQLRASVTSVEECRASEVLSGSSIFNSPTFGHSPLLPVSNDKHKAYEPPSSNFGSPGSGGSPSPIEGRTARFSGGYDTLMTRQRSQGQASQTSRGSRTSSLIQDRLQRADSQASQESVFGLRAAAPLSPPLSEHRSSASENLATTLQLPGFGRGVEPGLEAVDAVDRESGLILASESSENIYGHPTPTASVTSVDNYFPMRHDTSFYKLGGFCEGAKAMMKGDAGLKMVKRPSGTYGVTASAKCIKCSYEVGWNEVEKDRRLDRAGIYGNSGIRWRQTFISKSHVRTSSVEEPFYACLFCIEENATVEVHDATVFFSVTALFHHLARHTQPLPAINGITTLYGQQPSTVVDFDIHFTHPHITPSPFPMSAIASKVAGRPTAHALITHNPKTTTSKSRDPDGALVLNFAIGAHIIGITFPSRFAGQWCIGYHDGQRGAFPASAIALDLPVRGDVAMNAQSSLTAVAKWDFKPKEATDGGWIKLAKGERVSCVGYAYQDQWCWSGRNEKGKWGLFPSAFVEGLTEGGGSGVEIGKGGGSLRGLKIGGLSLGRKKSAAVPVPVPVVEARRQERSQPGLEVVGSGSSSRNGRWG